MFWDDILYEIKNNKNNKNKNKEVSACDSAKTNSKQQGYVKQIYSLGERYRNIYFTKREAECMLILIKGKTIAKTAETLNLSPRTIEFYIKNMKSKIGCRTKFELIELVLESEFLNNVSKKQ